jgi:hypothetical protein
MGKSLNEMGNCPFASPWLRHWLRKIVQRILVFSEKKKKNTIKINCCSRIVELFTLHLSSYSAFLKKTYWVIERWNMKKGGPLSCRIFAALKIDYSEFCLFLITKAAYIPGRKIRHIYGTHTAVNGQIRAVYAPYCYRNPGRWFTTVCNENTVCIRPYTAQNAVLYTVPIYDDQDYGEIRPVFVPYLIVNGRIRRSYD